MGYSEVILRYKNADIDKDYRRVSTNDVERAMRDDAYSADRLIRLLSPAAEGCLEEMARFANEITLKNFGRTIQLYTPLYLSNHCDNACVYCGFNLFNNIERRKLSPEELDREAKFISSTGLNHILILTGGSRTMSPITYIKDCIRILKKYFVSVNIEIYPLSEFEYRDIVTSGAEALTIYQETYSESTYKAMHPSGPKRDYLYRLDAPERGARAGFRSVNIGALLGLDDWRREAFFLGLHASYLQDKFPDIEFGVSVPRMRPHAGTFKAPYNISDKNIVQIIVALRIFLPRLGITISTREDPAFRENLIPLGITRMSAGSTTKVGGHTIADLNENSCGQFEISDDRSVDEIKEMLEKVDYQPIFKDWVNT